jgi:hypothetical protein
MAISQKEIRDWCIKNRYDYNVLVNRLEMDGVLLKKGEKFTMTRGTDYPTVQQRCIVVDMHKLDVDAAIPNLTLVQGSVDTEVANG